MDTTKQPGIWFDNVLLKELFFKRKPELASYDITIKFTFTSSIAPDKKAMNCELVCDVTDKNDVFNLHCAMIGVFSYVQGKENMDIAKFAESNAAALLLPYIREIVSTTTVQAGLPPIRIPPINIRAILKDQNGKITGTISAK